MDSIGTLEMENRAYDKACIFSWIFYTIIIQCSLLQYACFVLYNEKYHPMAMIVAEFFKNGEFRLYEVICSLSTLLDC